MITSKRTTLATGLAGGLTALVLTGCMPWMRDADYYSTVVSDLLDSRSEAIAACYDRVLDEHEPALAGEAVVSFDVEAKTGVLTNVAVSAGEGGLPPELGACLDAELAGLRLSEPDTRTGHGSASWQFVVGPKKRPPADPFAGAQSQLLACYQEHLKTVDREAQNLVLVVDYRFEQVRGTVEQLEVVADETTAPQPLVACASTVLGAAQVAPDKLEERNLAGRRRFTLHYTPVGTPAAP